VTNTTESTSSTPAKSSTGKIMLVKHTVANTVNESIEQDKDEVQMYDYLLNHSRLIEEETPQRNAWLNKFQQLGIENNELVKDTDFITHPMATVHVTINDDEEPTFWRIDKRQTPLQDAEDANIEKAIAKGRVRYLNEDEEMQWSTPYFTVIQRDPTGAEIKKRTVFNATRLNPKIKGSSMDCVAPSPDYLMEEFREGVLVSELDLESAYEQLRIHPHDQLKLAFYHKGRACCYVGAPYGLKHLPGHFQKLMYALVKHLKGVKPFFDNLYIITKGYDYAEHYKAVKEVLMF
jgi:hypothetical protein